MQQFDARLVDAVADVFADGGGRRRARGCSLPGLQFLCGGLRNGAQIQGLQGLQGVPQAGAWRVGFALQAEAAAGIAFAGEQYLGEALGLAKGVAAFQQAHGGGGTQGGAAVDVAMFQRDDVCQFAAVVGRAQPLAQGQ